MDGSCCCRHYRGCDGHGCRQAVLFCIYHLITLLGDPVNAKMEAVIDEDKADQLKDMSAKLDKRWAKTRGAGEG